MHDRQKTRKIIGIGLYRKVIVDNMYKFMFFFKAGKKVQHIIDIWKDGYGVVSLHCFQSVIPVEAYTREACMVDAIGK